MLLLLLTWKNDGCFITQLGQLLQSSKTPELVPKTNAVLILQINDIYEQDKYCAQLSMNFFFNFGF